MYMCAIRPFEPAPWTEIDLNLINQTRADMLVANLETFGVPAGTNVDWVGGTFTFGDETILSTVPRDGRWPSYLANRDEPDEQGRPVVKSNNNSTVITGIGLAEPERLLIPIINLANAIPLLAANLGRKYNDADMRNWRIAVAALLGRLHRPAKVEPYVEELPNRLRDQIRAKVTSIGANMDRFLFLQPGTLGSDLDLLLEYVAYLMFTQLYFVSHTPDGHRVLTAYINKRRLEMQQWEQATWMLEDTRRRCAIM